MFRQTYCFWTFCEYAPVIVQNQVLCYLVRKEMVQTYMVACYVLELRNLRLNCEGENLGKDFKEQSNRLKKVYFPGVRKVDRRLITCWKKMKIR